jgi:hypothetical protein
MVYILVLDCFGVYCIMVEHLLVVVKWYQNNVLVTIRYT